MEPVRIGITLIFRHGALPAPPPPPPIVSNLYCHTCHATMKYCTTPHPPTHSPASNTHWCFLVSIVLDINVWKHKALSLLNGGDKPKEDSDDDTEDDNQPYVHLKIYGLQGSTNG